MSDPKRSDYTGKKPSSADRVSDRLIEASERIEALERALLEANDRLDHLDALLAAAHANAAALREALEHAEAQRDTARRERDTFQDRLSAANVAMHAARQDIQAASAKLDTL